MVAPPDGIIPAQPDNSTLIQIGFLYPLNYEFVVANDLSIKQIFHYLPLGVAYGLGLDQGQVLMQTLQPYDTTQSLGYVTTLAMAFVPSSFVNALSLDIHNPVSTFYANPDDSVNTLVSMINPSFPIQAGGDLGGTNPGTVAGSPTSTASAIISEGAPLGGGSDNTSSVKAASVGIGVGVCVGAAVYGAAMFFVAKRYRKRNSIHRRSPSLIDTSSMAQSHGEMMTGAGAALMSGGGGHSAGDYPYQDSYGGRDSRGSGRSGGSSGRQQISAPVMAENSLGWN